jgi:CHAT domain-containing protein
MRDSRFYRARTLYRMDRLREAEAALAEMKRLNWENDYYPDVSLLEGLMHQEQGEYGLAQTKLETAAHLFEQSGDWANAAAVYSNLSLLHVETGDYQRALADERKAYAWHTRERSASRKGRSQMNLGFILAQLDSLEQAQAAYRSALASFRASAELRGVVETKLLQGELSLQHGRLPEAERDFIEAAQAARTLGFILGHARACLNLAASALAQRRFAAADSLLSAAEEMAAAINSPALKTEAQWRRAQLAKQQAQPRLALSHLEQAIALQEKMFGSITRDSLRVSYFATVQDFFDEAVTLALALGENERALHFAERGRARALLEAWGEEYADSSRALLDVIPSVAEAQKSLPAAARVIAYRVLPQALVKWLISPNEFITQQWPIAREALEDSAQKFLHSLGARDLPSFRQRVTADVAAVYEDNREQGRKFYELLLGPLAQNLAAEHELYIIPDGVLHQLPFGALVTPNGRFVEEENLVLKAPSLAALYHGWRTRLQAPALARNRLLYAGDPAGDLPAAALEMNNVAELFAQKKLLVRHHARFDTIKTGLHEGAEVFHLSLHAVADPQRALNSYLELSRTEATSSRPSTERIYARRLLEWEMSHTWLVLLNGCETATGQVVRGEGVLNLARLFALQRVSVVMASLWKNDDRWSVALVSAFYRHLAAGASPQAALHRAKLDTMKRLAEDAAVKYPLPYFWSVMELYLNRAVTLQQ